MGPSETTTRSGLPAPSIRIEDLSQTQVARSQPSMPTWGSSDHDIQDDHADVLDLESKLRANASKRPHPDGRIFWSEKQLRDVVRLEDIRGPVRDYCNGYDNEGLVQTILRDFIRVFAVLTLIGKEDSICLFVEAEINDLSLPLVRVDDSRNRGFLAHNTTPAQAIIFLSLWKPRDRDSFDVWQYQVNPPFFDFGPDHDVKHKDLDCRAIMPFLEDSYEVCGGFGKVFRVRIQPDCHGFRKVLNSIITDDVFAAKRIPQGADEMSAAERAFRKEIEALKRYSGFVHDHLVTLLMTWNFDQHYCLLFPYANKDLDMYLKEMQAPVNGVNPEVPKIRWLAKQIWGMAGAIDVIHNSRPNQQRLQPEKKYGRHGDIKPENVLWYECPNDAFGILVIADMGLTTFNSTKSRSNVPGKDIPTTPGYRGPECDLERAVISRSYDIWTFGCLLLELCCWALGGHEEREKFETARTTPYITGCETSIFFDIERLSSDRGYVCGLKRQVSEYISHLHGRPMCTQYFHELLDLIETDMLIPPLAETERIRSEALLFRLEDMYERACNTTGGYCQEPCPQKRLCKDPVRIGAVLNSKAAKFISSMKPHLTSYSGAIHEAKSPEDFERMDNVQDLQ